MNWDWDWPVRTLCRPQLHRSGRHGSSPSRHAPRSSWPSTRGHWCGQAQGQCVPPHPGTGTVDTFTHTWCSLSVVSIHLSDVENSHTPISLFIPKTATNVMCARELVVLFITSYYRVTGSLMHYNNISSSGDSHINKHHFYTHIQIPNYDFILGYFNLVWPSFKYKIRQTKPLRKRYISITATISMGNVYVQISETREGHLQRSLWLMLTLTVCRRGLTDHRPLHWPDHCPHHCWTCPRLRPLQQMYALTTVGRTWGSRVTRGSYQCSIVDTYCWQVPTGDK